MASTSAFDLEYLALEAQIRAIEAASRFARHVARELRELDDENEDEGDDTDEEEDYGPDFPARHEAHFSPCDLNTLVVFDKLTRRVVKVGLAPVTAKELARALWWHLGLSKTKAAVGLTVVSNEVYAKAVFERALGRWRVGLEKRVGELGFAQEECLEENDGEGEGSEGEGSEGSEGEGSEGSEGEGSEGEGTTSEIGSETDEEMD